MATPIPPEPTTPYAPLLPWLRRLGYAFGATLLFLLIVRLTWGWYAQRTLDAALTDLRHRGDQGNSSNWPPAFSSLKWIAPSTRGTSSYFPVR